MTDDTLSDHGRFFMHIETGNVSGLEKILQVRPDAVAWENFGETGLQRALEHAGKTKDYRMAEILHAAGANVNAMSGQPFKAPLLFHFVLRRDDDAVIWLLDKKADVALKCKEGDTVLDVAIVINSGAGSAALCRKLVLAGARVSRCAAPSEYAARCGNPVLAAALTAWEKEYQDLCARKFGAVLRAVFRGLPQKAATLPALRLPAPPRKKGG